MATEFERIAEIRRRLVHDGGAAGAEIVIGIGDDAAVFAPTGRLQVCSVDTQVEGVHFRRDLLPGADIGYRAVVAALSDLAAMGARPRGALVAMIVPRSVDDGLLYSIVDGIAEAQRQYACAVVGGNLARGSELSITTTVIGEALSSPLTRAGARVGDTLCVTGELGSAALGLQLLLSARQARAPHCVARWRRPIARIQEGLALMALASGAIDVSDGLVQDLNHFSEASGVGFELDIRRLPLHPELREVGAALGMDPSLLALSGGEDYELAFTVPARRSSAVGTRIGRVVAARGVRVLDAEGKVVKLPAMAGFDHFE